jgi:hypothetical protein
MQTLYMLTSPWYSIWIERLNITSRKFDIFFTVYRYVSQ